MIKLLIVLSLMLVIPLSANAQTLEDMTFNTTSSDDGQWVNYELPPSLDGVTVSCNPGSGAFFLVGTTNVTCTSTNITGYIGSESFLIDIVRPIVIEPQFNYTSSETSGTYTPFVEEPVIQERVVLENTIVEYSQPTTVQVPTVEIITDKEVLDLRLRILQVLESIFRIVLG